MYDSYPRRYGKSKQVVYTKDEFYKCVKRDNGFSDVFISIYSYSKLKEIKGDYKIDSESAIIDKVFVDIDFKDFIDYNPKKISNFFKEFKKQKTRKEKESVLFLINHALKNYNLAKDKKAKTALKLYSEPKKQQSEKDAFNCVLKLETKLRKRNFLRIWVFTGGGFHLYLYTADDPNNKKFFFKNCVQKLSDLVFESKETYYDIELKLKERKLYDLHCPPKLSQMARVIGTYNSRRKLYCVSLTEEDIDKGLEHIKEKAKHSCSKINYLGNKIAKFGDSFDAEPVSKCSETININIENYPNDLKELLKSFGILFNEIPKCVLLLLEPEQNLNYTERYLLITYLYRCGLNKQEIVEVLKKVLTSDRLYHCCGVVKNNYIPSGREKSRVETQIQDIIENDYYISCNQMMENGFCVLECKEKDILFYIS